MNLEDLAIKYESDKQAKNGHGYTFYYEKYLGSLVNEKMNILELGVREGYSLKMWCEYFRNSMIWGIDNDIEKKCPKSFEEDRIRFFKCDQNDELTFSKIHEESGDFDIIIDDASHISPYTIKSLQILYPYLKNGGYYIIEDLHVCGIPQYLPWGIDTITHIKNMGLKDLQIFDNKIAFIRKV